MAKSLGKHTLGAGIARINVGKGVSAIPIDVHFELLCDKAPYFRYFKRVNAPVTKIPISLMGEDADVFAEVISWMYRGQLDDELSYRGSLTFLLELWVLAEKLKIPALQNQAIAVCMARVENSTSTALPTAQAIEYVYTKTNPASPLRRFLVDVWIWRGTAVSFAKRKNDLPRAFVEDLSEALLQTCTNIAATTSLTATGTTPVAQPFPPPPKVEQYLVECAPSAPDPSAPDPGAAEPAAPAPESPPSRSASPNTNTDNSPRLATPEQMANRKIKSPSPRLRENAAARKLSGSPEPQDESAVPTASTSTSPIVLPPSNVCD